MMYRMWKVVSGKPTNNELVTTRKIFKFEGKVAGI